MNERQGILETASFQRTLDGVVTSLLAEGIHALPRKALEVLIQQKDDRLPLNLRCACHVLDTLLHDLDGGKVLILKQPHELGSEEWHEITLSMMGRCLDVSSDASQHRREAIKSRSCCDLSSARSGSELRHRWINRWSAVVPFGISFCKASIRVSVLVESSADREGLDGFP